MVSNLLTTSAQENCPGDPPAPGCTTEGVPQVFGYLVTLPHELAHAVGDSVGVAVPVVEEGFAISHGGDICASIKGLDRLYSVREFVDVPGDEIHASGGAAIAGHFAIHLSRTYGPELWSDFKASSPPGITADELAAAFDAVYDTSLEDAERLWYTEAPRIVCPSVREPVTVWTGAPLTFTHDLDCDEVDTLGPFDRTSAGIFYSFDDSDIVEAMYVTHRVILPFVDVWHIELDGPPGARALFYGLDCTDYGPGNNEQEREVSAGDAADLPVDACNQRIVVLAPPDEPARVELRITRAQEGG